MHDPRYDRLADTLIGHSTELQAGEHLLIEAFDIPPRMVTALVRRARDAGAHPHVALRSAQVMRALVEGAGEDQLDGWMEDDRHRMSRMDAYIGLRGSHNVSEMAGLSDAELQAYTGRYATPVHGEQRLKHTRWVVLRWPTPSMAQLAGVSTPDFEDFYFDVCTLDYARMAEAAAPLRDLMARTDRVRIQGPGDTDLTFSLKGIDAVACTGDRNIPDGECFSAPVRDSVNGVIQFNTPTLYLGRTFENVRLEFREGRIEGFDATGGSHDDLAGILDTDAGARYAGEFAIGFNPYIREPMRDILFDEKISGSLHFTPGRCYEAADNGNVSDVHWDLVLIQRPEHGGGTITFDDTVIRRDGFFTLPELQPLNPDNLKG